jgi:phenylalanyl-tRNA synthetase beta chain
MGGATTEMSATTADVLVEAGVWDPITIARTVRRHKLPSEAAKRYERGVDPRMSRVAAARVVAMLVEHAGGTADPAGAYLDDSVPPQPIELPLAFPAAIVGVEYTPQQVVSTLELIGATVSVSGEVATVTPPSWRPRPHRQGDPRRRGRPHRRLRPHPVGAADRPGRPRPDQRAARSPPGRPRRSPPRGATEVLSYPFVSEATVELFEPGAVAVRLANALDPQASLLRRTLLPGLLETGTSQSCRAASPTSRFSRSAPVFRPEPGVTLRHGLHPLGATNDRMTRRSPSWPPASRPRAGASVRCSSAMHRRSSPALPRCRPASPTPWTR